MRAPSAPFASPIFPKDVRWSWSREWLFTKFSLYGEWIVYSAKIASCQAPFAGIYHSRSWHVRSHSEAVTGTSISKIFRASEFPIRFPNPGHVSNCFPVVPTGLFHDACQPRTASWAKFSRPYGTRYRWITKNTTAITAVAKVEIKLTASLLSQLRRSAVGPSRESTNRPPSAPKQLRSHPRDLSRNALLALHRASHRP
jgi:hypothetical protein